MNYNSSCQTRFDISLHSIQRLLKLTTPLGENRLLAERVIAEEGLSTPFIFTVDCLPLTYDLDLAAHHFIRRLLEEEAAWWYVAQESDKHGIVFTDDNDTCPYVSPPRPFVFIAS